MQYPKVLVNLQGRFFIALCWYFVPREKNTTAGVEIETVNAYGASNKKESPHYTDQMELFVNQQLKPMTLDKAKILKEAVRVYSPK